MKDEKELKEMMVSEDTDHDDVEMGIGDPKAEIGRRLKDLNKLSLEEKAIMEKIQKVLEEHDLKYSYDEDKFKHIGLVFSMDNRPFKIHIILQNGKVIFRLSFPFRVQANAFPLMCLFMAEFNENKSFSLLNLDFDDGELTLQYSYMLENPEHFNEKYFWVYMKSLIYAALGIYTKVAHMAVGMVSGKDRKFYKKLLEMALETMNGDFDDNNVIYGTKSLKSDSVPDRSDLFGKVTGDEAKEDDSDFEGEDITSDNMRSLRRRRGVPGFGEFMRMKAQGEESGGEEETKDQPKKVATMLSMFAKRDEDKEPKVDGENEDE